MIATLSSVFGALATVLAIVGLYGVMAYMVTRRGARDRHPHGARGAARNMVWLVMREVLALVGAGIAIGVPAAWALSKLVHAQLYGVRTIPRRLSNPPCYSPPSHYWPATSPGAAPRATTGGAL